MSAPPKPSAFSKDSVLQEWQWDLESREYLMNIVKKIIGSKNTMNQSSVAGQISEFFDQRFPEDSPTVTKIFNPRKYISTYNFNNDIYTQIYIWASINYSDFLNDYPRHFLPKKHVELSKIIQNYREFEKIDHDIRNHSIKQTQSDDCVHEECDNRHGKAREETKKAPSSDEFSMKLEANIDRDRGEGFKFDLNLSKPTNIAIILGVVVLVSILIIYSIGNITTTGDCSPGSISGSNSGININCD